MGKIEVEDLTSEALNKEQKKANIIALANGLVQTAGRSGPLLGLDLKDSCLSLFVAAEILGIVGEESAKIDDLSTLKGTARRYAKERRDQLEKAGILDVIKSVGNVRNKDKDDE